MNNHFKIVLGLLLCLTINSMKINSQEISPYLIGNNAWYDGSLANIWGQMKTAKFQAIRIGGAGAEGYGANYAKYTTLIDGIRSADSEPIVQVPRSFSDQQAKDFIKYINITSGKHIKYWIIGNEPNMTNHYSDPATVGTYIRTISSALKSIDPTILVIGPETAWYDDAYNNMLLGGSGDITGKDAAGNYYIDVYSWHKYGFIDISGIESNVNSFLTKISSINAKRPEGKKISWGLTEWNTTFNNDQNALGDDQNVWSFRAGQLYAEIYGLGMRKGAFTMTAWSMLEGEIERMGTDLSLFDKDYKGRSNYYHSLMLGQNMKTTYITSTDNQSNVTVISMKDATGTAVMVLNKDVINGFDYSLKLNTTTVSQTNVLNININASTDKEIYGYIPSAATQMLVFDVSGNLTKRYIYTANDAYARRGPVIQTDFCSTPPAINLVSKQYKPIDKGLFSVNIAGITDADKCTQGVIVTAISNNPSIIAVNAVNYTTCNKVGTLDLLPKAVGSATITVTVTEMANSCTPLTTTALFEVRTYNPVIFPATMEAEDYIDMYGVKLQTSTNTLIGSYVGYIDQYDWMDYGVRVPTSGSYNVNFRISCGTATTSATAAGAIKLLNGNSYTASTLATITANKTGGWEVFETQNAKINLVAGDQILRIKCTTSGLNVNYLEFTLPNTTVTEVAASENTIGIRQSASDVIFDLSMIESLNNNSALNIVNMSGQLVYQKGIEADMMSINNKIFKSGLYIVYCQTGKGCVRSKFILN